MAVRVVILHGDGADGAGYRVFRRHRGGLGLPVIGQIARRAEREVPRIQRVRLDLEFLHGGHAVHGDAGTVAAPRGGCAGNRRKAAVVVLLLVGDHIVLC